MTGHLLDAVGKFRESDVCTGTFLFPKSTANNTLTKLITLVFVPAQVHKPYRPSACSFIRSKLDYGCIVYGSARGSYLQMLDPVQNHALRLCLGACRTSPSSSLCVFAN